MKFKQILFGFFGGFTITVIVFCLIVVFQSKPEILAKYRIVNLDGGTFDVNVTMLVTEDTSFALKYVKENIDSTAISDNFNSRGTTFTSENGGTTFVWLPNTDDKAVIMHELLHATIDVMRRVGVPLTDTTEEAYTYEFQYLINQFYKQNQLK